MRIWGIGFIIKDSEPGFCAICAEVAKAVAVASRAARSKRFIKNCILFNQQEDFCSKFWQVVDDDLPHNVVGYGGVIVYDTVSGSNDSPHIGDLYICELFSVNEKWKLFPVKNDGEVDIAVVVEFIGQDRTEYVQLKELVFLAQGCYLCHIPLNQSHNLANIIKMTEYHRFFGGHIRNDQDKRRRVKFIVCGEAFVATNPKYVILRQAFVATNPKFIVRGEAFQEGLTWHSVRTMDTFSVYCPRRPGFEGV